MKNLMPDTTFRALCAELVAAWDSYGYADAGDATDRMSEAVKDAKAELAQPGLCDLHREMVAESAARRARTELVKPEPVAPTAEELYQFWESRPDLGLTCDEPVKFALAVLARYGAPAIQPVPVTPAEIYRLIEEVDQKGLARPGLVRAALARWGRPAIEPVPVKWPPGAKDLDEEGWCWCFDGFNWMRGHLEDWHSYWLPHHALPTPEATNV